MKYEKAIEIIRRQLQAGETILASCEAGLNDPRTNNGQFGAIALTETRLLFVGDILRFNRAEVSLPLSSINSINRHTQGVMVVGPGFNVTRVTTHSVIYDFLKISDSFKARLEAGRLAAQSVNSLAPPPLQTLSVGDELAKLASLREAGVLTDVEFTQAKLRLLGQV